MAETGYPDAQRYALDVLDRLTRRTPRALALGRDDAPTGMRCGPYAVDDVEPAPDSVRAGYAALARQVAVRLVERAATVPAVRRAARCLLDDLEG